MRDTTLELLRCVARGGPSRGGGRCLGELSVRDPLTLVCRRCATEFDVDDGNPRLVARSHARQDPYSDEARMRDYWLMHFGPWVGDSGLPAATMPSSAPSEALFTEPSPTECFYRRTLDIVARYVRRPQARLLDLGCGLGRSTFDMAGLSPRPALVLGVDISTRMIGVASALGRAHDPWPIRLNDVAGRTRPAVLRFRPAGADAHDNCDFLVSDALELGLTDDAFDLVACHNLVDRVYDPAAAVDEAGRVVRPGGYLVLSCPYDWFSLVTPQESWVADLKELVPADRWSLEEEVDPVPLVLRHSPRRVIAFASHLAVFRKAPAHGSWPAERP